MPGRTGASKYTPEWTPPKITGAGLRKVRQQLGMSCEQFAKYMSTPGRTMDRFRLSSLERGERPITLAMEHRIAEALARIEAQRKRLAYVPVEQQTADPQAKHRARAKAEGAPGSKAPRP